MQKKQVHNKLVRDNIVPTLKQKGIICETTTLDEEQMIIALMIKIGEEINELKNADTEKEKLEELADIFTVIRELKSRFKNFEDLRKLSNQSPGLYISLKNRIPKSFVNMRRQLDYADSIEVLLGITTEALGYTYEQIEEVIINKQMVNGGFKHNVFLVSTLEETKDSA